MILIFSFLRFQLGFIIEQAYCKQDLAFDFVVNLFQMK